MKRIATVLFLMSVTVSLMSQEKRDTSDILFLGQYMPEFTVTRMNGDPLSSESLKGKTVLINFFATWCPPCRKELPYVQTEIYDQYKDRDDFVLMIISREEKPEKVIPFVEDKDYPMTFYSDIDRSCYSRFAHQFIPRNYLFDSTGKLVYTSRGFTPEEFENLLTKLRELLK